MPQDGLGNGGGLPHILFSGCADFAKPLPGGVESGAHCVCVPIWIRLSGKQCSVEGCWVLIDIDLPGETQLYYQRSQLFI